VDEYGNEECSCFKSIPKKIILDYSISYILLNNFMSKVNWIVFFFFLFIFKISRSVSFAGSSGSLPGVELSFHLLGGLPGSSFSLWFPFKCDAWQSSLFHSSHASVPISFSLSPPSYDDLHPTLFPNVSVPNSVYSCFFHYSPECFHFATRSILFVLLVSIPYVMIGLIQVL